MLPSSESGTLKSTRIRSRLPYTSISRIVFLAIAFLVDHALVVVQVDFQLSFRKLDTNKDEGFSARGFDRNAIQIADIARDLASGQILATSAKVTLAFAPRHFVVCGGQSRDLRVPLNSRPRTPIPNNRDSPRSIG